MRTEQAAEVAGGGAESLLDPARLESLGWLRAAPVKRVCSRLLLASRLESLDWLRASHARELVRSFPVDMLLPAEPAGCGGEPFSASAPLEGGEAARASTRRRRRCELERRLFTCLSREQVARADAAEGPRPDALGSLLVLRCLLRHGRCDAPRWISKGAAGLLVVGLSAASPSARSLAYEAVAALMAVLRNGPSFRERPLSWSSCCRCGQRLFTARAVNRSGLTWSGCFARCKTPSQSPT